MLYSLCKGILLEKINMQVSTVVWDKTPEQESTKNANKKEKNNGKIS